jgi:hypothetical protein
MHYIWHPNGNHMIRDCRIFIDRYTRKGNNGDKKEDNQKRIKTIKKVRNFKNPREQ